MDAETIVRGFYACYSEGRPEDFDRYVSPDYLDCGHTPPGRGAEGARDDYVQAVAKVGGIVTYTLDAIVTDEDVVAVVWTGTLPNGDHMRGLSTYRIADGLIASTRHTLLRR
ncbi:nuclear transport factor 2 family protein [Microbacterium sp. bgisy203]|uniref:nuclear transport factor 2 family protein n=1 Tax=Microbacterium sp. bgisy203 TaxID=3413799 RepID=UPI003D71D1E8